MPSLSLQALLARASAALERGRGAEAVQLLTPSLRSSSLTRDDELAVRCAIADGYLQQDDSDQASASLGRPPDTFRDTVAPERLSALWRLHGRVASARGDQSRAIAMHGRALRSAEAAHDSREIGLAHYELAQCYKKQVGDDPIVREHATKAASALHAAGDCRHLAQVHSLSGISFAQSGRYDEALAALGQAERLAVAAKADDILATICGNQANVTMMQHRYEQALALAERSAALHEAQGSAHGVAVALATLGQICVRLGDLGRAETALHKALTMRSPIQFRVTTGAVFDTLAQIHLIRGTYDTAEDFLTQASDVYGAYGRQTSRWYEWSVRLLRARLALRRGALDIAVRLADEICQAEAPAAYTLQASLIGAEALAASGRIDEADVRLASAADALDPKDRRLCGASTCGYAAPSTRAGGHSTDAYHDFAQSATLLDLLGDRYQAALSHLSLGRLVARTGARSVAERHLRVAEGVFRQLGAERDLRDARAASDLLTTAGTGEYVLSPADADDVIVRRIVDAAALPDLLARETAAALFEAAAAEYVVLAVQAPGADVRAIAAIGVEMASAREIGRAAVSGTVAYHGDVLIEPLGRDRESTRLAVIASPRPFGHPVTRRLRMIGAVARQGFALCAARDHSTVPAGVPADRSLEPLLPGFLSASPAMDRVIEQIQRLQGNDLTVLITGESGTGKELVARAIHVGSHRSAAVFLPYNCTTTGRELADSQLFGHRRGAFTGAVSDQPGLIRSAAGGTLFLDEIGDLALDVQPKLLRFLEYQEILPIGESKPQRVDVRVIAATNADLEQRVAEGKFREDLYYRLSVIRIHVPPLRDRREEIPHLATYFLREACEQLGKPDVKLSSDVLSVMSSYLWPGNVRQLRNQIQRAVALSAPAGIIRPEHLSADVGQARSSRPIAVPAFRGGRTLADAVAGLEREMIQATLDRAGNVSETARVLGLTRRGLYLKLRRLGLSGDPDLISMPAHLDTE